MFYAMVTRPNGVGHRSGNFLLRIMLIILSLALVPFSVTANEGDARDCQQVISTETVAHLHSAPSAAAFHCSAGGAVSVLPNSATADNCLSAGRRLAMTFVSGMLAGRSVLPDLPPPVIPTAA